MTDYSKYIGKDEQIIWRGESNPEGPPADPKKTKLLREFGVLDLGFGGMFVFGGIYNNYSGSSLAGALFMAGLFMIIGVCLLYKTFSYKQEDYCLTNKHFIITNEKGSVKSHTLFIRKGATVTGVNGEYGSILIRATLHGRNPPLRVRGIRNCEEVCKLINDAINNSKIDLDKKRAELLSADPSLLGKI